MPKSCPACFHEEQRTSVVEFVEKGAIYQCTRCGLQYVDPLPPHVPIFEDFTDYGLNFFETLGTGDHISSSLTPNERVAFGWLKRHISSSGTILELCCESGRFLAVLQRHHFKPLGMDPLPKPIAMLNEKDFNVRVGMPENYPPDWPDPDAVVFLESLVRFPAPVEILKTIRQRFPKAPLCLSVPSPCRSLKVPGFDRRLDYPPHHLTRWTPRALLLALENAGYRGKSQIAHVDIYWRTGLLRMRILKFFLALFFRLINESEYSIVGIGWPE